MMDKTKSYITPSSKEKILELLAGELGIDVDDISPGDRFKEDLHMNLVNISDFGQKLAEKGFSTSPEEISDFETVGELIENLSEE